MVGASSMHRRLFIPRRVPRAVALAVTVLVVYLLFLRRRSYVSDYVSRGSSDAALSSSSLPYACGHDSKTDQIFVLMKTGASEARQKLPVHFHTTFSCVTEYAIFSDVAEVIDGHRIYDVLADINPITADKHPEFGLYRELRQYQKTGRTDYHRLLVETPDKESNPAWKLDRWKFLPLLERAAELKPDAQWYVIMEADTNIVWSNLYHWLEGRDSFTPQYLGSKWLFKELSFAHGGSAFIISSPTLQAVLEWVCRDRDMADTLVGGDCCGDLALGRILNEIDITVTETWPMLQNDDPEMLDYSAINWCFPVLSHHHMSPEKIEAMWAFQQTMLDPRLSGRDHRLQPIMHRDVYEHFVQPFLLDWESVEWDNMSTERYFTEDFDEKEEELSDAEKLAFMSAEACRLVCELAEDCMQWTYRRGSCSTATYFRLGRRVSDWQITDDWKSGWMLDRIERFKEEWQDCEVQWTTD